jgi:hypothetical protein
MHYCYAYSVFGLALRRETDGGGFEPPVPFGTHALQACTINRSVTHPFQSLLVLVIVLGSKVDHEHN